MTYTLSPEQKVVSKALLSKASSDIKYFDLGTAFLPIYKALITILEENKNALIHVPARSELMPDIERLLEGYRLTNITIDIGKKNPIPETDIIYLRSLLKKEVDTTPIINHLLNAQKLQSDLTNTVKYYQALDRKVHTDRTFRNFASSLISRNEINISSINITDKVIDFNLDLSGQEYYNIKRSINKAVELYNKEFDLLDKLGVISKDIWSLPEDGFLSTRNTFQSLNQDGKKLLKKYKHVYSSLKEEATDNVNTQMNELITAIEHHQKECIATYINETYRKNEKNSGFSIFGKKSTPKLNNGYIDAFDTISAMISDISKEWYDELPAPTSEDINYTFIDKFLAECKANISEHTNRICQNLEKSIHRINRINTSSEDVKVLDKELTQLITKLDDLTFIQQEFNSNSISFIKQMEICQSISSTLDQCHSLLGKDTPYTIWKRSESVNSPLSNIIINEIKDIPKSEWISQFDLWYNKQISATILSDNSIDKTTIPDLLTLNNEITNNEILALTNKLQTNRLNTSEDLKSSSKELYNTLFKKKTLPTVSWSDLVHSTRSSLQSLFPLHISNSLENASKYDMVISFSRRNEDSSADEQIQFVSPILQKDIDDMSESKDLFLYLNTYNYNAPITELPNAEKLKASKKLAKFILSLNQQIKIYQLKTGNIISLLPPADDNLLISKLDEYGIKSIDVEDALYDKLTESILFTERQPYLIIKDELINPEMHQHLMWQAEIIQIFRTAGYKVLSLNTDRQLEDNEIAMNSLVDILVDRSTQKTEQNNQLKELPTEDVSKSVIA